MVEGDCPAGAVGGERPDLAGDLGADSPGFEILRAQKGD
jgi:hypothetical protein